MCIRDSSLPRWFPCEHYWGSPWWWRPILWWPLRVPAARFGSPWFPWETYCQGPADVAPQRQWQYHTAEIWIVFPGSIAENRRTGQRQSRKSPRKRGMLFPFEWSDCFLTVSFVKSFQFSQLLSKNLDIFSTFYRIRWKYFTGYTLFWYDKKVTNQKYLSLIHISEPTRPY